VSSYRIASTPFGRDTGMESAARPHFNYNPSTPGDRGGRINGGEAPAALQSAERSASSGRDALVLPPAIARSRASHERPKLFPDVQREIGEHIEKSRRLEALGRNKEAGVWKRRAAELCAFHKHNFAKMPDMFNKLQRNEEALHAAADLLEQRPDGPPPQAPSAAYGAADPQPGIAMSGPEQAGPSNTPEETMVVERPTETFDDVIGIESAKRSLREATLQPLRWPQLFGTGPLAPWRGILLYGPPGTGKTMLAKAAANEAKCVFYSINASNIMHCHVGVAERRVREIFEDAQRRAPAIIFLDECDSLFKERSDKESEVVQRVKTEFFTAMAGFAPTQRVLVIAATNLFSGLDKAIVRRFDVRINVLPPDEAGRAKMFSSMLGKLSGFHDLTASDFAQFARATPCCTGADIEIILRDAIYAARARITSSPFFCEGPEGFFLPAAQASVDSIVAPEDPSTFKVRLCVSKDDVLRAIHNKPPALKAQDLKKYEELNT
jgi:AAA+ superfamily predicted ATPase